MLLSLFLKKLSKGLTGVCDGCRTTENDLSEVEISS